MKTALLIACLATGWSAVAASGNPKTRLPWPYRAEVLQYHSCGTADRCWVAQVGVRASGAHVATLRCDGEKLFVRLARRAEMVAATDCRRFERDDKFEQIPLALREWLRR